MTTARAAYPRTQPIPKDVVADLHAVRVHRDLTYDDLANELDMPRSNTIRFMTERGARVSARTLQRIRAYLARDVNALAVEEAR